MNYSKADLRDQALTGIGVIDPNVGADGATLTRVNPMVQQFIEYLNDENLLIFDSSVTDWDAANIPGRVMPAMQDLLELRLGRSYGVNTPRQEWEANWQAAMGRLRKSILAGTDDVPVVVENF